MDLRDKKYIDDFLMHLWTEGVANRLTCMEITLLLAIVRRMECLFEPYAEKVAAIYNTNKDKYDEDHLDKMIRKEIGSLRFYRTTTSTMLSLCKEGYITGMIGLHHYYESYDKDTLAEFKISGAVNVLGRINSVNALLDIIQTAGSWNLGDNISDDEFTEMIAHIIERSQPTLELHSQYTTPSDISKLMTELLFVRGISSFSSLYDPACGMGMLLRTASKKMTLNSEINGVFGQDENMLSVYNFLIDKATRRNNTDYVISDTLTNDLTGNNKFDFIVSDLPLGQKNSMIGIHTAHIGKSIAANDTQTLFIQHIASKLTSKGRAIFTCTPNFFFSERLGVVNARGLLLKEDFIDAVIMLPKGLIFASNVDRYLCIIDKNKVEKRKGKLQIINAANLFVNGVRGRTSISEVDFSVIMDAYQNMKESEVSHIIDNSSFFQYTVDVLQPKRDEYNSIVLKDGVKEFDKDKTISVRIPGDESDFLGWVNKNVLAHLEDGAEIDFSSLMMINSMDLKKYFEKKIEVLHVEQLVSYVKEIQNNIQNLFGNIFIEENPDYTNGDVNVDVRGVMFNAVAKLIQRKVGLIELTKVQNENPILSVSYLRDGFDPNMKYAISTVNSVYVEDCDPIIIARGENAGEVFMGKRGLLGSTLYKVDVTNSIVNKEYLYYLLKNMEPKLCNLVVGVGMKNLRVKDIHSLQLNIPSMEKQLQVVEMLHNKVKSIDQLLPMLGGQAKETVMNYRQALIADVINKN